MGVSSNTYNKAIERKTMLNNCMCTIKKRKTTFQICTNRNDYKSTLKL